MKLGGADIYILKNVVCQMRVITHMCLAIKISALLLWELLKRIMLEFTGIVLMVVSLSVGRDLPIMPV